ncbi:hypothetical protein B0A49_13645 [Cryomyces minteri]|uniref:GRIP domain-containing protein n=1 Tax=Cryomyces minteri TaxID=331657 RepID=A0A4U0UEE3_9PEZI|nr:hypothetical protein B0A49_13645 [Cryomyces minteri]
MQDQTRELATQMKEVRERCESLEEELADAHRLLGERSREGETMRRLLADVEGRAEARVKEMRERMDLAIEERDRAEDEASTIGRRRARESEELKAKVRDLEKALARATEEMDSLSRTEAELRAQNDATAHRAALAQNEVADVRTAMLALRDTLDSAEALAGSLERDKHELRRALGESQQLRAAKSSVQSSRSSLDSTRVNSPAPAKSKNGSLATMAGALGAEPAAPVDYVYLKNVLLQFLEQRDKRLQIQLVPVLGMLLHFDRTDEQKWMAAITAK